MKGVDHSVNEIANDIIFFLGLIILAVGLWMIEPWLSLTIVGVVLLLIGWFRSGGD